MIPDEHSERRLVEGAGAALECLAEGLEPGTRARLDRARAEALAGRRRPLRPAAPKPTPWLLPLGGMATAAVVMLAVALWPQPGPMPAGPALIEDVELLADAEGMAFYEELEFFLWLEETGGAG